jgi:hypothetical protein
METQQICPYLESCTSKPEELPTCIPNYAKCLVFRLIEEEKAEYDAQRVGLIRFLERQEKARKKGWTWDYGNR